MAALGTAADARRISDILLGLGEGESPPTAAAMMIAPNATAIQRCFSAGTAEEILHRLQKSSKTRVKQGENQDEPEERWRRRRRRWR